MRASTMAVVGGGGQQVEAVFTAPEVVIGETRTEVVVAQIEPPGSLLDDRHLPGSLGAEALTRFNYAIDPTQGLILLWKRRGPAMATPKSTFGVQGVLGSERIRIAQVMANSPAATAELRVGDEICAIDDTTVTSTWGQSQSEEPARSGPADPSDRSILGAEAPDRARGDQPQRIHRSTRPGSVLGSLPPVTGELPTPPRVRHG